MAWRWQLTYGTSTEVWLKNHPQGEVFQNPITMRSSGHHACFQTSLHQVTPQVFDPTTILQHTGRTPLPKSLSAKHADFTGSSRDMQWHNNRHLGHFVACELLQPNCCIPCLMPNALKCMEMHSGTSTCQQTWCHKRATIVYITFPAPGLRDVYPLSIIFLGTGAPGNTRQPKSHTEVIVSSPLKTCKKLSLYPPGKVETYPTNRAVWKIIMKSDKIDGIC